MIANLEIPVESTRPTTCASRLAARAAIVLASLLLAVAAQAQHDCFPYELTEAGEVINSTWAAQFERDNYQFTVPADPGGGYVIARIETTAPSRAQMRIIPPDGQGVVAQVAPSFPGPSPQVLEVAFEVDAGTTFDVEIFEDAVSQPADFPVPYKWSWTFVSRVDCYEANDGSPGNWPDPIAGSKTIPLDQVLEAYSLAGHQTFVISAFDAQNFDWYNFTLDEPTEVWLATLTTPLDQSIRVRLFGSDGLTVVDQVPETGQTGLIGPTLLQPGTIISICTPRFGATGTSCSAREERSPTTSTVPIISSSAPSTPRSSA
jgi:hypothetical protein